MAAQTEFVPNQHATEAVTAHVIWMTTGLGCDGDSVAMTSATNPSLEDIVQGIIPGMPRVVIHTPVLAYETGAEFMQAWYDAEAGKLDPFVLIVEGSIPNEKINGEGHWAGMGVNPENGQPITTNEWLDRLAPKAAAVVAIGTCATYGGIPAMKNNPTGAMGVPDYLGWEWKSKAGLPVVCLPGCPTQPDNTTEALLYLVLHLGGMAPVPELDDQLRPIWLYGRTAREGCNRAGYYRAGATSRPSTAMIHAAWSSWAASGPVAQVQRAATAAGSTASAAAPTWAASAWRARCRASPTSTCRSWMRTPRQRGCPRTGHALHLRAAPHDMRQPELIKANTTSEPEWRHNKAELTTGYAKRW